MHQAHADCPQAIFIAPGFQQDTENRYDPEQCCFQRVLKHFFQSCKSITVVSDSCMETEGKRIAFHPDSSLFKF